MTEHTPRTMSYETRRALLVLEARVKALESVRCRCTKCTRHDLHQTAPISAPCATCDPRPDRTEKK